jgi:signal transduction histidine kinase
MMKKLLQYKIPVYFFLAAILFFAGTLLNADFKKQASDKNAIAERLQNVLSKKEDEMLKIQQAALATLKVSGPRAIFQDEAYNSLAEKGFTLFLFDKDSLLYWSDVQVPVETTFDTTRFNTHLLETANGFYNVQITKSQNYTVLGLILIKHRYKYENEYLKSSFHPDYGIGDNVDIQKDSSQYSINCKEGEFLCSLTFNGETPLSEMQSGIVFSIFLLGFLFLIGAIFQYHKWMFFFFKSQLLFIPGFIIDILLLRLLIFHMKLPDFLYNSALFSPINFASSELFPSFGDLLINSLIFIIISLKFYKHFNPVGNRFRENKNLNFSILTVISFVLGLLYAYLIRGMKHIVIDSVIPYTLNNLFNLNIYSILGLLVMAMACLGFTLLSIKALKLLFPAKQFFRGLSSVLAGILLFAAFQFILNQQDYFIPLGFTCFMLIITLIQRRPGKPKTFTRLVLLLIFFSVVCTISLYNSNLFKENEKRKSLAQKLSNGQDPVAEFLYSKLEPEILKDQSLKNLLKTYKGDEAEIESYINKRYFNGYWDKYQVQITLCSKFDSLFIKPAMINQSCKEYFDKIVNDYGSPTGSPSLNLLNYGTGGSSYLSELQFDLDSNKTMFAFIEMYSKFIPKGLGYPELLIDKKIFLNTDLSNYSYARYYNGVLSEAYGKYYYSINQDTRDTTRANLSFFNRNKYNHLYFRIDKSSNLIVSIRQTDWFEDMAPFSLLFLFFSLFTGIFYLLTNYPFNANRLKMNFKNRLQISMVAIILISFILLGISLIYYIRNLNEKKNTDNLSEKALSILTEVQSKMAPYDTLSPDLEAYLSDYLVRFSNVFFTDINLYDAGGNLYASSRPQVFDEGLLSRKINNIAYYYLVYRKKTIYIHKEQIGNLEYYSAYVPFYNAKNKLTAYLNLPYFARESELKVELSSFMMTFINIYVFLIALAVIIALIIAGRMTRPLKEIRDKISHVRYGGKNEKIVWKRQDDEIGSLVTEYNRMIDELALSADLLSKSERESAWREMAKQVAHEIKNPLTPMKLSVQYLEKAWKDGAPDWDARLNRFSKTLIEQIDSLSAIASAFSDFAKMPKSEMSEIDIIELLKTSMATFSGNITQIHLQGDISVPIHILADRKQINRVIINLVTNALQAIGNQEGGNIMIHVEHQPNKLIISVNDNGPGIPDDQKSRIFVPNFSTKSEGMGLGLAMVKSIIESHGGSIWFHSEEGKGASFFFELPL